MKNNMYASLCITKQNIDDIKFQLLITNSAQQVISPEIKSLKLI